MKPRLDMNRIAKGLRARRRGKLTASSGYFAAMQLAADVQARFQIPRVARPTDPALTLGGVVPLAPPSLMSLQKITAEICKGGGASLEPLQLEALPVEKSLKSWLEELPVLGGSRSAAIAAVAGTGGMTDVAKTTQPKPTSEKKVIFMERYLKEKALGAGDQKLSQVAH